MTDAVTDEASAFDHDVIVIGSGFGGSVSALRLTEKGYRVAVLESGRRFASDDYPKSNWNLRKFIYMPRLGMKGFQRMRLLSDVLVLSGAGVGGGSLVYANTLYEPLDGFYTDPQWEHITDWRNELATFYDQAKRMLGATTAPDHAPNDAVVKQIGERMGVADTYRATDVGVYLAEPGRTDPDPYFGGAGPDRTGCIQCGACMIGCRHNAKNSLDRNYLHLAEQAGAVVFPEQQVIDLVALDTGGYEVYSQRPGLKNGPVTRRTAEQVIFSAGVLGTIGLLAELQDRGRLEHLSPRLGELVRTNSESISGATAAKGTNADYSVGVAISSSIYPDEHTHIEGVRYPAGSNAMGLLSTMLVSGQGRFPRPVRFLGQICAHPIRFLRSLSVHRWSERSVILLVMQSRDNSINLRWKRGRKGIKLRSEQGRGEPNPTFIPEAEVAARHAADIMNGDAMAGIHEALLDTPVTAHILGGCVIGVDEDSGVIDAYQRVFGHPGLHVADGSAISANLGVNPSLTITAQAERVMAMWPNKNEPDLRPRLGDGYRRVSPVAPAQPTVPPWAPGALAW